MLSLNSNKRIVKSLIFVWLVAKNRFRKIPNLIATVVVNKGTELANLFFQGVYRVNYKSLNAIPKLYTSRVRIVPRRDVS